MNIYKMTLSLLAILFLIVSSSFLTKTTHIDEYSKLGGWVKLGTQTVSLGADYDELDIPEVEDIYKRLKFKVAKAPVHIRNIHVVYEDGTSEGHIITHQFRKGESSRILDLIGHGRIIKKIIFNYSRGNSRFGQADLVILARQ